MTHDRILSIRGSKGLALPVHRDSLVRLAKRSASGIVAVAKAPDYRLVGTPRPPPTTPTDPPAIPPLAFRSRELQPFNPHSPTSSPAV
jgi:hypothetical protein